MTLLSLDLDELEALSEADPDNPGTMNPAEITAMRALRRKIRSHLIKFARQLGAGSRFPIAGRPDYPATPEEVPGSAEPQEAIAWSQEVLNEPDGRIVRSAFLIALYNDPDSPAASKGLTMALGTTNTAQIDTALRNALVPLLPLMAKGKQPGR